MGMPGAPQSKGPKHRNTRSRVLRASKEQDTRRNGGLGFSTDAMPPWIASALFQKDKAGPRPSPSMQEQVLKENKRTGEILEVT